MCRGPSPKNKLTEINLRGNKTPNGSLKNTATKEIITKNFCRTWYLVLKK